jgi:hypothetical protein
LAGWVPLWGNIPPNHKKGLKRGKKGKTYIVYNIVGFGIKSSIRVRKNQEIIVTLG